MQADKQRLPAPVAYCAPSNAAVDVALEKVLAYPLVASGEVRVVRLLRRTLEQLLVPEMLLRSTDVADGRSPRELIAEAQERASSKDKEEAKRIAESPSHAACLHRLIRNVHVAGQYAANLVALEKTLVGETVMTEAQRIAYRATLKAAEVHVLRKYADVVFLTTSLTTTHRCTSVLPTGSASYHRLHSFSGLVLDEAGMCTDGDTLASIACAVDCVALVGDHRQLQPVLQSRTARDGGIHADRRKGSTGLGRSLFERLFEDLEKRETGHTVMLRTQYRMHEHICAVRHAKQWRNQRCNLKVQREEKAITGHWSRHRNRY